MAMSTLRWPRTGCPFPVIRKRLDEPYWVDWSDEELLDLRFCDLDLTIEGTPLVDRVDRLYDELARRDIRLRPHVWLTDEWFCPDGVPGIGIPFYLAHPRLARLERKMMFEVEGGTESECMKILRHEAGHALCNGYRLHYRKRWRETFGKFSERYPTYYRPCAKSRDYVLHLDWWYAQSHPAEDFAETFAVWLRPKSGWRTTYADWPALRKLHCVDEMMQGIAGEVAAVRSRQHVNSIRTLRTTLRQHYRRRHRRYADDPGDLYDRDLKRLFSNDPEHRRNTTAAQFLRRNRTRLRGDVAEWTSVHPYSVDRVIRDMVTRSRKLNLRVGQDEADLLPSALLMIAVQTVYLVQGGQRLVAL